MAAGSDMKTLNDFISSAGLKFALITRDSFDSDPVAQQLSGIPAVITVDGIELVILSIPTDKIAGLVAYAEQIGSGIEFQLTLGSGRVTLLTHQAALALVQSQELSHDLSQ
jgi:hypothetical protein